MPHTPPLMFPPLIRLNRGCCPCHEMASSCCGAPIPPSVHLAFSAPSCPCLDGLSLVLPWSRTTLDIGVCIENWTNYGDGNPLSWPKVCGRRAWILYEEVVNVTGGVPGVGLRVLWPAGGSGGDPDYPDCPQFGFDAAILTGTPCVRPVSRTFTGNINGFSQPVDVCPPILTGCVDVFNQISVTVVVTE